MLRLLGCGSPNVFKVLLMLHELEVDYEFEEVPVFGTALSAAGFRRLNPNGRLPVLIDDGLPVFESGAILIHLAEKSARFLPAAPDARSQVLQWLMWQVSGVGPMFGQALHFRYIAPADNRYATKRYSREVARLYDVAEKRLVSVPWLGGEDFSIADIAAYPWLGRYTKILEVDMSSRPMVRQWIDRIEGRTAHGAVAPFFDQLFRKGLTAQANASAEDLDRFFGR